MTVRPMPAVDAVVLAELSDYANCGRLGAD
jgi:hypothetical protein